jgi:peptide/nickel transport system ATP-binding protein
MDLYRRLRLPNPDEIGFRYPHQVSGGQLQRAMTAMAMACRPDLIIFDEPTTALDVTTQIEVLAAIRDIVEQFDTAAIYITHDLAVVAQMADKIKVLLKGDEVEEADTRTMLDNPKEDYTKSLWAVRSFKRPRTAARPKGDAGGLGAQRHAGLRLDRRAEDVSFDIHARPHRRRRGRIRLRQVHHGARHHRPAAAAPGRDPVQRRRPAARLPPPHARPAAPGADDLPDGRHGAEPQAPDPRDHRTSRPEFYGLKGKALKTRSRPADLIELEPSQYSTAIPRSFRAARSSASASPGRWPPSRNSSSATRSPPPSTSLVAEGILKLLDRLQGEFDLAYMFITHDLATVRSIADEVVVMKEGKWSRRARRRDVPPPHDPYTDLLCPRCRRWTRTGRT